MEPNECDPEEPVNSWESANFRCNNLQQEALKFVELGSKSIYVFNVAMESLCEAAKKVDSIKSQSPRLIQGGSLSFGDNQGASGLSTEEKVKKIQELTAELDETNKQCEVYRANLFGVLKDVEDQKLKLKLSLKVQNARLLLKE